MKRYLSPEYCPFCGSTDVPKATVTTDYTCRSCGVHFQLMMWIEIQRNSTSGTDGA